MLIVALTVVLVLCPLASSYSLLKEKEYTGAVVTFLFALLFGIFIWEKIKIRYNLCETTSRLTTCCLEYDHSRSGSYCLYAEPCMEKVCVE